MKIDEKRVIEVIGRMIGRATSHKCSAEQTLNEKKAEAHWSAHNDLMSLADDLANATDDPEFAKSKKAYKWAVSKTPNVEVSGGCSTSAKAVPPPPPTPPPTRLIKEGTDVEIVKQLKKYDANVEVSGGCSTSAKAVPPPPPPPPPTRIIKEGVEIVKQLKKYGANVPKKDQILRRRLGGPVLLLLVAIACGLVPGEADGASLAGVPNIVFILLNVCLTCYALGMIYGKLTANDKAHFTEVSDSERRIK